MRDVAIVGGGPGGLYAAGLLARAGHDVVVFEEHAATGAPVHCTGVLATSAFDELELPGSSILNELHTAHFHSPSGQSVSFTPRAVEAVAVDRLAFDDALFRRARASGAVVTLGRRVEDVIVEGGAATLRLKEGGAVKARLCILACGAHYAIQRRLGLGMPAAFLQSAQLELPAGCPGDVEVHFGREVAPEGFAWLVPVRRATGWHARVGLMCERDSATYFRRFLASVSARWEIGIPPAEAPPPRQKLLPLAPIDRTYADRVLVLGDAAGIVKATTGGGIYYSVLSGALAAETASYAIRRGSCDAATLARYERAWQRRLGAEIRAQLQLRALAHKLDDADMEAFFHLARTDGVMPIVRQTARFNQHRHFIVALLRHPPARRVLLKRLGSPTRPQEVHDTHDQRA
jgi:digeranylgeranylglycerophospholipid reductase